MSEGKLSSERTILKKKDGVKHAVIKRKFYGEKDGQKRRGGGVVVP